MRFLQNTILLFPLAIHAFVVPPLRTRQATCRSSTTNDDDEEDRMQQLRILLEASWNQSLMGNIPTTPLAAAIEIAHSMQTATTAVSIVDLQLPSLDLRQGTRWYDAVLTTDLAQLLVERLFQDENKKAVLLVRDQATVRTVERVWKARLPSLDDDDGEEEESSDDEPLMYDDFADFGFVESIAVEEISQERHEGLASVQTRILLRSLFGDDSVSEGADMEEQVIRSLQANVVDHFKQQENDFDTIVMIAPVTRQEVMAVRALVQKYSPEKRIILINPQLPKPRPIELRHAQTVYSLRPFLVRSKDSQQAVTKIVVLKRKDWELFISNNGQFERLPVTIPKDAIIDGPSMEWVAACAQQYLQNSRRSSD